MGKKFLTDLEKIEIVQKYTSLNGTISELSKEYNCSTSSIRSVLKVRGALRNKIKFTCDENYFDIIDTEEKAYFLGLLYADGSNIEDKNVICISLQECDLEILEKFKTALNSNRPIRFRDIKSKHPTWQNMNELLFYSHHMSQSLAKLGVVQRKTLILKFPTEEQVPKHLLRHFIRGYWDGDGSFSILDRRKDKRGIDCTSSAASTDNFCCGLKSVITKELGIHCSIIKPNYSGNTGIMNIYINGNKQVYKLISWLYLDSNIFLKRKYEKFRMIEERLIGLNKI